MHKRVRKQSRRSKLNYYANILVVSAITLIVYGLVLNLQSGTKLFIPKDDVIDNGESTVVISTSDGSQIVPGNTLSGSNKNGSLGGNNSNVLPSGSDKSSNQSIGNQVTNDSGNNNGGGGNQSPQVSNTQPQTQSQSQTQPKPNVPTIEETNDSFRNTIQNTYGITVKYGAETNGYVVGGISTTPISDSTVINSALNNLNNTLAKYPKGFFDEIRKGGIPLTIILINNYSNSSITGITDSNYSFAHISIAITHPFEESFFHESYHYIERYIFKRGGNFSAWDSLNPPGFVYNSNISNANSYANTFSEYAPFVNTYAQTAATEDRASTFEYMMASSKASCLNRNMTVWKKAKMMSDLIDAVFSTVRPDVTEYWERHL